MAERYWRVIIWDDRGERAASPKITDKTKMKKMAENRWNNSATIRRIQIVEFNGSNSKVLIDKKK